MIFRWLSTLVRGAVDQTALTAADAVLRPLRPTAPPWRHRTPGRR
jgi:hypothetical protein